MNRYVDIVKEKIKEPGVLFVLLLALFNLIVHLFAITKFGYFRDELYYLDSTRQLGFGYVDHPPLSIFILSIIRFIFGDSLIALRMLPVLSGSLVIVAVGYLAKEMGGKGFAVSVAAVAAFARTAPGFHKYSMNFIEHLFLLALFFIILRIIKTQNPKYWLLFGIVAGVGLQNKISILFFSFGIIVGLIATPMRRHLKSAYLWGGVAIAGLLFAPYVIWNAVNGWPTREFIETARAVKMTAVTPLEFLVKQIFEANPLNLLIWVPGLLFFFFHKSGKSYRLFGWMYLAVYILFTIQQAKAYYLSPLYWILFAGGAILWERVLSEGVARKVLPVFATLFIGLTLYVAPLGIPLLPVDTTVEFHKMMNSGNKPDENHEVGVLPQDFADMHGWEELTEKIYNAYSGLSAQEQKKCTILCGNYGLTGAVNLFGKKYSLPTALSGHNSHFFWWPEDYSSKMEVVIIVGISEEFPKQIFNEVTVTDHTNNRYCMPYENGNPIMVCRGLKIPPKVLKKKFKSFN